MNWNKLASVLYFFLAAIYGIGAVYAMNGIGLPSAGYNSLSWVTLIVATGCGAAICSIIFSYRGCKAWQTTTTRSR